MISCAVIIPIGPGHEMLAERAVRSVQDSWAYHPGRFSSYVIQRVRDPYGKLGRSAARNLGMNMHPGASYHFLLDADDQMVKGTFCRVDVEAPATFGAIMLCGEISRENVYPVTRETLRKRGALGTLSMGCFVRGDLGVRFDESLDVAEDFDFYMRLPGFVKVPYPLVDIGYDQPSAGGPRGYDRIDWLGACNSIIQRHVGTS